jgi:phage shock protein E
MHTKMFIFIAILLIGVLGTTYVLLKNNTFTNTAPVTSTNMKDTVTPDEFVEKNTQDKRIILDVRTPKEFSEGHISGAKNLDFYSESFSKDLENLDKNAYYSVYCRSGNRSYLAMQLMQTLGFKNIINLSGGIMAWERDGKELCTTTTC